MRIVVTGGAGFIGSTLVDRLLENGHSVVVVDNLSSGTMENLKDACAFGGDRFTFCNADIRSKETRDLLIEARADLVFHLAAQMDVRVSVADPAFDTDVNVIGSINVLEGCRRSGTSRIVFASSGGTIYGDLPDEAFPAREDGPQLPLSPYGINKKLMLDYLRAYEQMYGLSYVALALGNVYGPRQDPHGEAGVVSIFGQRLLSGLPCTIFGGGLTTRDYVYVDDVVDAFIKATSAPSGLYNVGSGIEVTTLDVYRTLANAANVDLEPEYAPPRIGELHRVWLDVNKAQKGLRWSPSTGFAEGCARTISFIRSQ